MVRQMTLISGLQGQMLTKLLEEYGRPFTDYENILKLEPLNAECLVRERQDLQLLLVTTASSIEAYNLILSQDPLI
jgi:hypothetical protein